MLALIALVQKWLFLQASRGEFLFPLITNTLNVDLTFFFLRGCKYNHLGANKTFSFLVPPGHSIHSIHHLFWRLFIAVINKQDAQRRQLGRFSGGSFNEVGGEQPKWVLTNPGLVLKSHLKIIKIVIIIMTWRLSTNKNRSFPLSSRPSALVFPDAPRDYYTGCRLAFPLHL